VKTKFSGFGFSACSPRGGPHPHIGRATAELLTAAGAKVLVATRGSQVREAAVGVLLAEHLTHRDGANLQEALGHLVHEYGGVTAY